MIYRISGIIIELSEDVLCIEQGRKGESIGTLISSGITWEISISKNSYTYYVEPYKQQEISNIYTYMLVSEKDISLYGFYSLAERSIFLTLLKVDGIGPKAALKILSHTTPEILISHIRAQDIALLSKLPGVGQKKASKILLTLEGVYITSKNNNNTSIHTTQPVGSETESQYQDIIGGLVNMGYAREHVVYALDAVISSQESVDDEGMLMGKLIMQLEKRKVR